MDNNCELKADKQCI